MTDVLPIVSIAIPTYNRANGYLRQAIQAALNQSYPEIDIIVSDNCSSDNTEEVVRGFADPRIRYFRHSANIGANNNFNFCLEQARGSYFLLLQDDDLIDSDFIDVCMRAACANGDAGIIRTGLRVIDSQGDILYETPNNVGGLSIDEFFRGWFAGRTPMHLCSTLFHTMRLREIGGFRSQHNLFQDVIAEVRLASKFGRADVQAIKASFRKHAGEMTFAAKVSDWCEDSVQLLDVLCELAENRAVIRDEGLRFFSKLNYGRAMAVRTSFKRYALYFLVFRKFKYRYPPSRAYLLDPIYQMLQGTPLYHGLRFIKRKLT